MPASTDALGALDDAHAAAVRAVEAARASLAAQPLDEQLAGVMADLAEASPALQRLKVRAAALPENFAGKPLLLQWATSGLAMPDAQQQMAALAQQLAAAAPVIAPKG